MLAGVGRDGGEVVKALLDRFAFDGGAHRRIQLRDDRRRCSLRHEQSVPALRLELRKARLRRGRQVGQGRKPHRRADDEAFHQLVVDGLRHRSGCVADAVDLAADRVRQCGCRAAIADQRDIDAGRLHKTLADQEIRGADPGMAEIDLAGILLRVGDEFLQVLGRKILAQRDDTEGFRDDRNGCERFRRERQLRIDRIGRSTGARIADGDGVAIGLGPRRACQRGRAAGARDILDHDRLSERLAHLFGDRARDHVRGAAGRERHDHGDGSLGIVLRVGGGRQRQRRQRYRQFR